MAALPATAVSRRSGSPEMYNGAWHPPLTVLGPDSRRRRARVVKLADTQDLGSCAFGRGGSSPPLRTQEESPGLRTGALFWLTALLVMPSWSIAPG